MTYEIFVPQLVRSGASLCVLCGGKVMNGLNCTTCSMAMWLYRASQGRVHTDGCHVRDLTNDCDGGTNLRQMETVAAHYGITTGRVYQPIDFDQVAVWVKTGRYGAILDISYDTFAGTVYDRFHDSFFGNHAVYLSGPGKTSGTIRTGDPGAVGYVDIPQSKLKIGAGRLDLGSSRLGWGKCYAYVTPIDPATSTTEYRVVIFAKTQLYYAPNGAKDGSVSRATYICTRSKVSGEWWYRITGATANHGRYLQPSPTRTRISVI